ncbi:DMT family transporter [Aquibaculum arenosum]|uniref:DMT family transporter n=1 Tax=Aquibaculum arenosum TaxID=3032591 RepID=A0ABT5YJJ2_9PROT|nr:DMT family transporter [Fodinicurvata sp. CAU 1616]MDF2095116.1 DMT family transporter [Fodinicurvata sp. CAU 1616]
MPAALQRALLFCMPAVFVLLWSTGFIGAIWGLPYAEPFTFLTLRFALTVALLLPPLLFFRALQFESKTQVFHIAVVGFLVHAIYLGGAFGGMARGLPAAYSALIVSLQPLLTAVLVGPLLGERVTLRQVLGLLLGLMGVTLVLAEKLAPAGSGSVFEGFDLWAIVFSLGALLGMTLGVVYQKRFCGQVHLWSGALVQYAAAGLVTGVVAFVFETNRIQWTGDFLFALGWLTLVLSLGAVSLLMLLIRLGEAARTASLFYLVPPATATSAWILFGDRMGPLALAGMAVAVLGVALVVVRRAPR